MVAEVVLTVAAAAAIEAAMAAVETVAVAVDMTEEDINAKEVKKLTSFFISTISNFYS